MEIVLFTSLVHLTDFEGFLPQIICVICMLFALAVPRLRLTQMLYYCCRAGQATSSVKSELE